MEDGEANSVPSGAEATKVNEILKARIATLAASSGGGTLPTPIWEAKLPVKCG